MKPLVHCSDLTKHYGQEGHEAAVLRGVDLDVEEGTFACIMGPSGSGKSTLLHLISGLDEPSSGSVWLAGEEVEVLSLRERTLLRRRTVGYVFQFFNLLPNLSVEENVSLPLVIAGKRPADHSEALGGLLERFGIERRSHALPHELSGGEMQRTSIARALAGGQPLLLCDEPTGNLSQKAGLGVMETLREVCDRDGKTVLLVTHNPRDAAFADVVHFLVDGRLNIEHSLHGPNLTVDQVHEALAAQHI
jgi:putative ABC transport system ATP-binding protein